MFFFNTEKKELNKHESTNKEREDVRTVSGGVRARAGADRHRGHPGREGGGHQDREHIRQHPEHNGVTRRGIHHANVSQFVEAGKESQAVNE